jgi:hypothetical protein
LKATCFRVFKKGSIKDYPQAANDETDNEVLQNQPYIIPHSITDLLKIECRGVEYVFELGQFLVPLYSDKFRKIKAI